MSLPSPQRNAIVEFVGLPAVGKSTISRLSAALLAKNYPRVREPIRRVDDRSGPHRVLSKGRFAAEHILRCPRTTLSTARNLFKTDQASTTDRVRVSFNLQYVAGVVARARSNHGVTLLDQGPYQGIWSVGLRSTTDWDTLFDRFECFLSRTAPDLVVLVEADTDTIAKRLHSREDGDTRVGPNTPIFDRGIEGYEHLKRRVQSVDTPETIVVNNERNADIDACAKRVGEAVASLRD